MALDKLKTDPMAIVDGEDEHCRAQRDEREGPMSKHRIKPGCRE